MEGFEVELESNANLKWFQKEITLKSTLEFQMIVINCEKEFLSLNYNKEEIQSFSFSEKRMKTYIFCFDPEDKLTRF